MWQKAMSYAVHNLTHISTFYLSSFLIVEHCSCSGSLNSQPSPSDPADWICASWWKKICCFFFFVLFLFCFSEKSTPRTQISQVDCVREQFDNHGLVFPENIMYPEPTYKQDQRQVTDCDHCGCNFMSESAKQRESFMKLWVLSQQPVLKLFTTIK